MFTKFNCKHPSHVIKQENLNSCCGVCDVIFGGLRGISGIQIYVVCHSNIINGTESTWCTRDLFHTKIRQTKG